MSEVPVLKRLLLVGDSRLPFVDLDLSDPKTGAPLSEVCLIGPNGCGKSALLSRLCEAIGGRPRWIESGGFSLAKFLIEGEELYVARPLGETGGHLLRASIELSDAWKALSDTAPDFDDFIASVSTHLVAESLPGFREGLTFFFDETHNLVDGEDVGEFGPFLEKLMRDREEAFHRFLRNENNRDKTVAEVEREFENHSSLALTGLAEAWDQLLEASGVHVDFGRSGGPFFNDAGSVCTERLGTALSKALLRTGLALSRRDPEVERSFFCDSPECGLHPSLADAFLSTLLSAGKNIPPRLFVVTHSPLVAARFAAGSRLRLQISGDGRLTVSRGEASAGPVTEALLKNEFGISASVPPPPPQESRERRSSRIKRAIRESENEDELADLIDEVITFRKD